MKVLCPTDFSRTSVNAINWSIAYLESIGGGAIEILHCLNLRSRSDMLKDISALVREPAELDLKHLIAKLKTNKSVTVTSKILNSNPKISVPKRAKKTGADLIVVGTTGLTNLKNITIGSVTEYIVKHTKIPVISVPKNSVFRNFNKIVLGVDKKILKKSSILAGLKKFIDKKNVKIIVAQVLKKKREIIDVDNKIFDELDDYKLEMKPIFLNESITKTLNEYATVAKAQIICIIHHKKNWFSSVFHHSILKEELFDHDLPILIIPD